MPHAAMVLIVLALLELAVILAFWRRSDPGDGDGPDHGGGPWRRPRRPPPDPPVCWEEWERQFSGDPAGSTRHPPD